MGAHHQIGCCEPSERSGELHDLQALVLEADPGVPSQHGASSQVDVALFQVRQLSKVPDAFHRRAWVTGVARSGSWVLNVSPLFLP